MGRIVFFSYIAKSQTLLSLTNEIDNSIIVKHNKSFAPKEDDIIIFWGSARIPSWYEMFKNNIVNNPKSINVASNKKLTMIALKNAGVKMPNFVFTKDETKELIRPFIVRKTLHGHGGVGIEVIEDGDTVPDAGLYVEYINKEKEYRVHVFNNKAIKFSRKIPRRTVDNHDKYVWNHDRGYYFNKVKPNQAGEIAIAAVNALGLDFGAVDIVLKDNVYYVLEVNTAPGLQNNSLELYKNEIIKYVEGEMYG